jgi:hypothetical protein
VGARRAWGPTAFPHGWGACSSPAPAGPPPWGAGFAHFYIGGAGGQTGQPPPGSRGWGGFLLPHAGADPTPEGAGGWAVNRPAGFSPAGSGRFFARNGGRFFCPGGDTPGRGGRVPGGATAGRRFLGASAPQLGAAIGPSTVPCGGGAGTQGPNFTEKLFRLSPKTRRGPPGGTVS